MRPEIFEAQKEGVDPDRIQGLADKEDWEGLLRASAEMRLRKRQESESSLPDLSGVGGPELKSFLTNYIDRRINEIMTTLNDVVDAVARLKSVTAAVPAAIQGIKDQYAEALAKFKEQNPELDTAVLDQVDADVEASIATLSDAVRQGTVADPSAPPADNGIDGAPDHEPPVANPVPTPDVPPPVEGTANPPAEPVGEPAPEAPVAEEPATPEPSSEPNV